MFSELRKCKARGNSVSKVSKCFLTPAHNIPSVQKGNCPLCAGGVFEKMKILQCDMLLRNMFAGQE